MCGCSSKININQISLICTRLSMFLNIFSSHQSSFCHWKRCWFSLALNSIVCFPFLCLCLKSLVINMFSFISHVNNVHFVSTLSIRNLLGFCLCSCWQEKRKISKRLKRNRCERSKIESFPSCDVFRVGYVNDVRRKFASCESFHVFLNNFELLIYFDTLKAGWSLIKLFNQFLSLNRGKLLQLMKLS